MTNLDFDKIYFFLTDENDGFSNVGFVKLIRMAGDKIHYKKCVKYQDLFLKHPKYEDEIEIEPYTEDFKEFKDWHHSRNISLCYSEIKFLEKRLYEVNNIDTFPMQLKIKGNNFAVMPDNKGVIWREWQLFKLLNCG